MHAANRAPDQSAGAQDAKLSEHERLRRRLLEMILKNESLRKSQSR